jgi:hypothetical protein
MVMEYARFLSDRHRAAVDVAVHAPDKEGSHLNYHAHLLVSTRRLGPEGFTEKTKELDGRATGPQEIEAWRQGWQDCVNRALERAGYDRSYHIDMRSYERQGKDREGQKHLGPQWTEYERKTGQKSYRGQFNDAVKHRNRAREINENEAKVIDLHTEREKRWQREAEQRRQEEERQRKADEVCSRKEEKAETFDRDAYHQAWQTKVDQAGIEYARRQEQRGKIEAWGNRLRAQTQSRQHDELINLDRQQGRRMAIKDEELRQHYGAARQAMEQQIAEITARQHKGGFGGFVYRMFGKARADREALPGLQKTVENSQWREDQARDVHKKELAREREALEQRHTHQRTADEQRVVYPTTADNNFAPKRGTMPPTQPVLEGARPWSHTCFTTNSLC